MKVAYDAKIINPNDSIIYSQKANLDKKDLQVLQNEELKDFIKITPSDELWGVRVIFEDAKSNKPVAMNLSEDNFSRLLSHFSSVDNYFLREDGSIRLNGEAENFISGWFYNIAYDLNFLNADADKNGLVEGGEINEAYNYVTPMIAVDNPHGGHNDLIHQIYLYGGGMKVELNENDKEREIECSLNHTVSMDKNMDGRVSFVEYFGNEKGILAQTANSYAGGSSVGQDILEKLKRKQKELDAATEEDDGKSIKDKALEKGIEALNMQELLKLKRNFPQDYERLKEEDLNALSKGLKSDLQRQFSTFKILDKFV